MLSIIIHRINPTQHLILPPSKENELSPSGPWNLLDNWRGRRGPGVSLPVAAAEASGEHPVDGNEEGSTGSSPGHAEVL